MKSKTGLFFIVCLVWVYLVILAGGTVRATGAGLGCPDWPLCFGQLIPPMSVSDLPENWKIHLNENSNAISEFNPIHTWTEYVNRLLGATLGILTIFLVFSARSFLKTKPSVFWYSLGAFLSVGFNGWLGSLVVSSELRPVMVSLHMLGAFAVQIFLIFGFLSYKETSNSEIRNKIVTRSLKPLLILCFVLLLFQIGLGIQIRESVDWIIKTSEGVDRTNLIEMVPWIFYVHRSFSWIIFAVSAFLLYKIYSQSKRNYRKPTSLYKSFLLICDELKKKPIFLYSFIFFSMVCSQMFIGGALNHLDYPILAQPIHLLVANLLFGLLCLMWGSCDNVVFDNDNDNGKLKHHSLVT